MMQIKIVSVLDSYSWMDYWTGLLHTGPGAVMAKEVPAVCLQNIPEKDTKQPQKDATASKTRCNISSETNAK